jgi:Ca2+-binding RTX toxin-like protein
MGSRSFVIAGVAACALSAASAGTAAFPGANGRLVFTQWTQQVHRFDEPRAYLCSADADGADQSRLTDVENVREGRAAFRPQGDRIAFTRGATTTIGELWTASADGSPERRIGDFTGSSPAWSADGERILIVIDGDIWSVSWPGGARTLVAATAALEIDPTASPDGTRIAFARGSDLVVRRLDDGRETTVAAGLFPTAPDWSPDSSRIVFATSAGDLHVVGADGSGLVRLGVGVGPAFSPDGSRIAFVRDGDVWTARPDGTDAARVTRSPAQESEPAWQPVTSPLTPRAAGARPCAIVGTDGDDLLVGSDGPDIFYGLGGNDVVRGLGGDDVVWDGPGNDTIETGEGDDLVKLAGGRNILRLGAGDDEVEATAEAIGPSAIEGGDGNDRLQGGTAADRLLGGSGNDVISGLKGPDLIFGGPGDDRLMGNRGDDYLDGGLGDDTLFGGLVSGLPARYDGYDILLGRGGNDRLAGGWQKDRLFAGPGRDRLSGGPHADRLEGGPDPDTLLGDAGDDLLLVRLGSRDAAWGGPGFDRATADSSDVLRGVERRLR